MRMNYLTALTLIAISFSASAMEFGVDQPDRWFDPMASHHYGHFTRGALTGGTTWNVVYSWTESKGKAWAAGTATSLAMTLGYELYMAHVDDSNIVDPVDMAWEMSGSLLSQGVSHLLRRDVEIIAGPTIVSVGTTWRF